MHESQTHSDKTYSEYPLLARMQKAKRSWTSFAVADMSNAFDMVI